MIGLKRATVKLLDHESDWDTEARRTIARLQQILGSVAKEIQHVGSTSIPSIKAKPIIDIALAVDRFQDVLALVAELRKEGFYYCPDSTMDHQLLLACGSFYDGSGDLQTHFIHVVLVNSMEWINYINFRDYLKEKPLVAKAYEDLKLSLAAAEPCDRGREHYVRGKHDFIVHHLRKALANSYLGKTVKLIIDRPIGSPHPQYPDLIYPLNYGYIPDVFANDGEELDVYLLGVDQVVKEFEAHIVAIVHRSNDVEDKLLAAPEGKSFSLSEISDAVRFQEQYYESEIEIIPSFKS